MSATTLMATKTVLVADDTAFVRDRFKAALQSAGHRALTIRSGADLLAQVRTDIDHIDLVVLDLRLPRGHGSRWSRRSGRSIRRVPPSWSSAAR